MAGSSVLLGGVVFTHGDEEWKKFGEKFEDAREGAALGCCAGEGRAVCRK